MLKDRQELRAFREECVRAYNAYKRKILVCAGTGCVSSGSLNIYARLRELIEAKGIHCAVELEHEPESEGVALKKSGCHGFCERGPLVRIEPEGWLYTKVKVEDCDEIVEKTIVNGEHIERLAFQKNGEIYKTQEEIPFYKKQTRVVLEHCGHIDSLSVKEYLSQGGYSAFEKALFDMTPDEVIEEVSDSGLRGRGGGGFPAGRKWAQVKRQNAAQKYVVCNGDEGDPGAFMDRSIMEGDPHRMLEGMMIAGAACGATEGYIYVRAEYPLAVERLKTAIAQAKEIGLLGKNILGSGFDFVSRQVPGLEFFRQALADALLVVERQEGAEIGRIGFGQAFAHVVADDFGIAHDHGAVEGIVLAAFAGAVLDAGIEDSVDAFFQQVFDVAVDQFGRVAGRIRRNRVHRLFKERF